MREKNKLANLKEYRKAKEITTAVTNDLEFLDHVDGKFDPFHQAVEDGNLNIEEMAAETTKRRKIKW